MRPVIAQKKTNCYFCKEPIPAGSQRLTDTVAKKVKGEKRYFTRHFHYDKDNPETCVLSWANKIFDDLPLEIRTNNPKGRPQLDLSQEDKQKRTKLLKSLRNQFRYYVRQGNIDLTPKFPNEIEVKDVKRAKRFKGNLSKLFAELEEVGGVPKQYRDYAGEPL